MSGKSKKKDSAKDLDAMRHRIDAVDEKIQRLISERARYAQQAGEVKKEDSSTVEYYRPEREAQVLRSVVDRNDGPLSDEEMARLFPGDHVGLPGSGRTAENRLSRSGGDIYPGCGVKAIWPLGQGIAAGDD